MMIALDTVYCPDCGDERPVEAPSGADHPERACTDCGCGLFVDPPTPLTAERRRHAA